MHFQTEGVGTAGFQSGYFADVVCVAQRCCSSVANFPCRGDDRFALQDGGMSLSRTL